MILYYSVLAFVLALERETREREREMLQPLQPPGPAGQRHGWEWMTEAIG
jgi:hypothetical protein